MFDIFLGPQPERFLKKADKELRQRIWKKLGELKQNPFPSEVVRGDRDIICSLNLF